MRTLKTGDIFRGSSYVDLINRTIGTNFNSCFRCLIEMNEFVNCCGLTSWFVFMNGDVHGSSFDWKWKNFLSKDEKEIKEYHVGDDIKLLNETRGKTGFYPFRLAFQLDPYENGSRNCCKFLGLFMLKEFLKEDSISSIKYVKVADSFDIGSKGYNGYSLFDFDEYAKKDPRYLTPISELDLDENLKDLLLRFNIKTAGRLLELGLESSQDKSSQIRKALIKHFKAN